MNISLKEILFAIEHIYYPNFDLNNSNNSIYNLKTSHIIRESKITLSGFASLEHAKESDVSFSTDNACSLTHANGFSKNILKDVCAGLLFVPGNSEIKNSKNEKFFLEKYPNVKCLVAVDNPYQVMVDFLNTFFGKELFCGVPNNEDVTYIHPTSVVEGCVGKGAHIGPFCVVMRGATIGKNCTLESNVTIYPNVTVGDNCIFQAGVVVGSRGFGFYSRNEFNETKRTMVPHFAGVRIGNNCSFGANTVIAAGFISPTTIGNSTHLDSMVQIAHNCEVGDNVYMASGAALAGSTIVKDNVLFAGAAKAAGHLTIEKNAVITAKAGVTKNVREGKTVAGFPAIDIDIWRRMVVKERMLAKKDLANKA